MHLDAAVDVPDEILLSKENKVRTSSNCYTFTVESRRASHAEKARLVSLFYAQTIVA